MNRSLYEMTSAFWYAKFRLALCEKKFPLAEEYYTRHKYWARRVQLDRVLSDLCNDVEEARRGK